MKESRIQPANWTFEMAAAFFFEIKNLLLFDRKIDHRASDCYDNSGAKVQDIRMLKIYFAFLCEFLLTKQRGLNSFRVLIEKDVLRIILFFSRTTTQ